jgi:hypothetical protein
MYKVTFKLVALVDLLSTQTAVCTRVIKIIKKTFAGILKDGPFEAMMTTGAIINGTHCFGKVTIHGAVAQLRSKGGSGRLA